MNSKALVLSSFKDFLNKRKSASKAAVLDKEVIASNIADSLVGVVIQKTFFSLIGFGADKKEEFAKKVADLVSSDAFITKLSEAIGDPLPNESKEEFVKRSKRTMRLLLDKAFDS